MSDILRIFADANQNLNGMKTKSFLLSILVIVLASCNPDVYFGSNDNVPQIAEKALGLTPTEAIAYMQKQGFTYEGDELHQQHSREFIFSKGADKAQFSFEAPIVIWLNLGWNDTINSIDATQQMDSRQNALNLYWKWSHYTASAFASKIEDWDASITTTNSSMDYENREQFWADFKKAGESIIWEYEHYIDWNMPKEISMGVSFEDDMHLGYYHTSNYIDVPLPCMPSKIRHGHSCD